MHSSSLCDSVVRALYRTSELQHSQKKEQDICPEFPTLWVIISPSDDWHVSLIVLCLTIQIIHLLLPDCFKSLFRRER